MGPFQNENFCVLLRLLFHVTIRESCHKNLISNPGANLDLSLAVNKDQMK